MTTIITLDVGGKLFKINKELLIAKSEYFDNFFKDNKTYEEPLYIDRCPHIFKHILGYIRDTNYPFPEKYQSEYDYFLLIPNKKVNDNKDKVGIDNPLLVGIGSTICPDCGGNKDSDMIACGYCWNKLSDHKYYGICPVCKNASRLRDQYLCSSCFTNPNRLSIDKYYNK
jgi:hypothetical protein